METNWYHLELVQLISDVSNFLGSGSTLCSSQAAHPVSFIIKAKIFITKAKNNKLVNPNVHIKLKLK